MSSEANQSPAGAPLGASSAELIALLRENRGAEARVIAQRYALIEALRRANQDELHTLVRATDTSATREELLQRDGVRSVSCAADP